jgi:hypothetical protein
LRGETQVSKARPGPPTQSLEVAALFSTERLAELIRKEFFRTC